MIAVIFEVTPTEESTEVYFEMAQALKSSLEKVDGFISVERFQSLTHPNTFLSLSFWQNETAITQWKSNLEHQVAQQKGRKELFSHYRIRVGNIVRDYGYENGQYIARDKPPSK